MHKYDETHMQVQFKVMSTGSVDVLSLYSGSCVLDVMFFITDFYRNAVCSMVECKLFYHNRHNENCSEITGLHVAMVKSTYKEPAYKELLVIRN